MLDFSEITIDDKALFARYLEQLNPQVSELCFTNFFMWRHSYKFRFAVIEDFLCVLSVADTGAPFAMMPAGDVSKGDFGAAVGALKSYFDKQGWLLQIRRVEEEHLQHFQGLVKSQDDMVFDRDNSDYVYLSKDLICLKGKKFDGKRNHINRFRRENEFQYVELDSSLVDECKRITSEWCEQRNCDTRKCWHCERAANYQLLDNYETLGCRGGLIRINGEYKAFTVGEMLNSDTAVIHVEKAESNIHGLYTVINQQFCEREWQDCTYINREQDLGVEGLRKAKLSYNPVKMINKYTVTIR